MLNVLRITRNNFQKSFYSIMESVKDSAPIAASNSVIIPEASNTAKKKYDGRTKKRKWEDRRSIKCPQEENDKIPKMSEVFERIKKRKYAVLLGYSGSDYYGMQRNPQMRTIEEDLFKSLLQCKYITSDAYDQIQTIQFQRAARTDKGVSASRQVISIKLPEEISIEDINKNLPDVIRVFGAKRVTKGFNSKSLCNARTYSYTMPTIAFSETIDFSEWKSFRIDDDKLSRVREILKAYEGTRNFHNYTSKKKVNDPSANRYIMSFDCEGPILRSEVQFLILKVKGQSFMMHQIRKMIGLCISICRNHTTMDTLKKSFTSEKVNIPKAPGLGLVLDFVHYDRYNNRYGSDGMHATLDWSVENDAVQEFTEKYIQPTIVNTELKDACMVEWLDIFRRHRYDDFDEDADAGGDSDQEGDGDDEKDS